MPASSRGWGTALAAALVAALTVLPLLVVGLQAGSAGWTEAADYLLRPRIGELLSNTARLMLVTVPSTVVVGVLAAWLVERTDLPGASSWRTLLLAPLAVPAFVSAYAWISLAPWMTGFLGAALVTTLAYFPFVFLPVAALLRALDGTDEEAARSLGLSPVRAVVRTVLPRLRPAISGGALLVALHLLAEFGVLEMMRFQTFTTAIMQQYAVGFSDTAGSLLASVLVLLCLLVLTVEVVARGRRRVARVGGGAHRRAQPIALGRWAAPALAFLTAVVTLAVLVPVGMVARWLLAGSGSAWGADLLTVSAATIGLAVLGGVVATMLALPGAWLLNRGRSAVSVLLERLTFIASALPGVVVALALVTLAVNWARPVYQTVALLVLAYAILFLPRAMVSLRSGLAAAPPELTEVARSLGASGMGAFLRVVLPQAAPSVLTGFVLVALAISTELTATLILAPTGTDTLALAFWSASSVLDYTGAAPYAAVMVLLSVPLTLLLRRQILGGR
ncbi:ABC transporter permease [Ornithinimicrobium cryptoxanthini]|uniref:Iron ABC transporter permease n=1 Tax=Ornithinimicrobium cryptoxanthini TaxID=2934161 RepID=A0ABY4YIM4_9MICO|nr:iron ABC transporter permease [Ornithinimicrobium cryptoxanthini]USQ76646.1 iron ABC transporter permease [Ornithinimicrobium cryptoxanthini]